MEAAISGPLLYVPDHLPILCVLSQDFPAGSKDAGGRDRGGVWGETKITHPLCIRGFGAQLGAKGRGRGEGGWGDRVPDG